MLSWCANTVTYLCVTCVCYLCALPVCYLCVTCVLPVCYLCATCVLPVCYLNRQVDAMLGCVATGSAACDPVARIELADAVGSIITELTSPDCDLRESRLRSLLSPPPSPSYGRPSRLTGRYLHSIFPICCTCNVPSRQLRSSSDSVANHHLSPCLY